LLWPWCFLAFELVARQVIVALNRFLLILLSDKPGA